MEWRDEGIVIGVRRHGENSAVVEAMTRAHGRHLGLVRGGRSVRLQSALQPGNSLGLVWRARLDEHLGMYAIEPLVMRAGRFITSGLALSGVVYLGALLRLLPERDPHELLFKALELIADQLDDAAMAPALVALFEARVLAECGVRPRPRAMRGDRLAGRTDLCLPEIGTRRERIRGSAVARPATASAGLPAAGQRADATRERSRGRLPPHRLFPHARSLRPARPFAARRAPGLPGRRGEGRAPRLALKNGSGRIDAATRSINWRNAMALLHF